MWFIVMFQVNTKVLKDYLRCLDGIRKGIVRVNEHLKESLNSPSPRITKNPSDSQRFFNNFKRIFNHPQEV